MRRTNRNESNNKNRNHTRGIKATLKGLKELKQKAINANLHNEVKMVIYDILVQHIENATKKEIQYKTLIEEKMSLSNLSINDQFIELKNSLMDIPVESEHKLKFKILSKWSSYLMKQLNCARV